jgi:diacylglycerol kinase family enzyme
MVAWSLELIHNHQVDSSVIQRMAVVYNAKSGASAVSAAQLRQAFRSYDVVLELIAITDGVDSICEKIRAKNIQLVIAAGGDGTVNAVANIVVKLQLPMGVIPAGTLNHFAKDAGIPLDIDEAAKAIVHGSPEKIDYCTVNDHVFINNSSIGTYPTTVLKRDELQPKLGKWFAATVVTVQALYHVKSTHLQFELNGKSHVFKTPLAFIGNNSYQPEKVGFANRERLTGGDLFLYVVKANRFTALLRLTVSGFLGKKNLRHGFSEMTKDSLRINSSKAKLNVAVDGEVLSLRPPLQYTMHAKSLELYI